jgi:hypothetical protein
VHRFKKGKKMIKRILSIVKENVKGIMNNETSINSDWLDYRKMGKLYVLFDGEIIGEMCVFTSGYYIFSSMDRKLIRVCTTEEELFLVCSIPKGTRKISVENQSFKKGWKDFGIDFAYARFFDSVGGMENRDNMRAIEYVDDEEAYLAGYQLHALLNLGKNWKNVEDFFE